ncbi:MAG: hypothetical protein JWL62_2203 [Hyphomicrobiales bacterium]|nr:hypothetical protein [Hyphomicrobiales bacterium]
MRNHLTLDERLSRASLDGRVAFAAAAFALGAGLIVLLDRVGLPQSAAIVLGFILVTLTLSTIGLLMRSVRVSSFYAAGRKIPASYAGLAGAAILAAMMLIFLPPLPDGLGFEPLAWGIGAGIAGLLLVTAPVLRKSGSFSVSDFLSTRFPSLAFRLPIVAIVAILCGLTAFAGFEQAMRVVEATAGGGRLAAALLIGALLIAATVPGGIAGSIWTGAAAGAMAIAGMAFPLLLLASRGVDLPIPFSSDTAVWSRTAERLADWTSAVPVDHSLLWLAAPIALALAGFVPLLSNAIASRDGTGAQHTQVAMVSWLALLVCGLAITLAATALGLDLALAGQRPDRLADTFYRASAEGWLKICGQFVDGPASARTACAALPDFAAVLRPNDYAVQPSRLVFELASVRGLGGAYCGLSAAGWFAVCVALASAGLQGLSTALAHDFVHRVADPKAITSRRLAITRLVLLVAIVGMAMAAIRDPVEPRALMVLALVLSAAVITPLMLLSLWKRAGSLAATLALLAGLGGAGSVMLLTASELVVRVGAACLAGGAGALATGLAVSLLPRSGIAPGARFLDALWHGTGDALNPDKGA